MNEIRHQAYKSTIISFTFLPHFLSWIVMAGIVMTMLNPVDGVVNIFLNKLGKKSIYFMMKPQYFRSIIIISGIIKEGGWGTIIYLAVLAGMNPELYESAYIDGANRGHCMWYITLPFLKPTILTLLALSISSILSSNFEQIISFLNPILYDKGDVVSTYIYRVGILEQRWEKATAIGLVFSYSWLYTTSISK